jgi:hypothetical protein
MCLPLLPEIICFYDNNISQVCQVEASAYAIPIILPLQSSFFKTKTAEIQPSGVDVRF